MTLRPITRPLVQLAVLALPLALAACGDDMRMPWDKPEPVAETPAEPAPPHIPEPTGASPTRQPLEVGGPTAKVATAEARSLAVTDLVAGGEGWAASVSGSTARFQPQGAAPRAVDVRRIPWSGGVEYIGTLSGQPFVLRIKGADCGKQKLTAMVRAGGQTYDGCASPAAPAAAPAAS
ncbi:hypothetical protein SAMN04488075_1224 [Paracoccus alkenifer]|uniref:Uncharacterized protein n=1 Tax=Paracoccus alkenifer TaxID=65735 RepID=A0A1H6LAE7_9RHOB|nr:hypothetical protein SAMN04488075_1224 [Paracoccus alkenifer]